MESNNSQRTLSRHCNNDGVCHCDWRLTIYGCEEANAMYYVYIINIALSGLVVAVGIALLFHRIFIKGHRLWDSNRARGCLRPKPVDALMFLLTVFNALRLVSSVILVADIAPTNMIARSFIFEIPWQFGVGSFTLYLVGIAQTLAESHKSISSGWLPSPAVVDIVGTWMLLWPFVVHNVFSLIAGAYAEKDLWTAEFFSRLLYGFWFYNNTVLSAAVFFAGYRLVIILNSHLAKFKESSGPRYRAVKTGIYKIQAIVGIIIVCLMTFASFLLLYGILRDQIMTSTVGSVFLGVIWTFLGPLTTVFVELAIIINPTMAKNEALGTTNLSSTGAGDTTNPRIKTYNTSSQGYSNSFGQATTTYSNADDSDLPDTIIMTDIKQQQLQYQQVFQKHAINNGRNTLTTGPSPNMEESSNNLNDSYHKGTFSTDHNQKFQVMDQGVEQQSSMDSYHFDRKKRKGTDAGSGSSKFELIN
ncbi:hypothetical protein BDC45DRAFT_498206 [Circinella umbellata]|nr:hypothetical protein BDC45DRAFT_498206 [Circinella umbellata]